jgi:hypothetical protein
VRWYDGPELWYGLKMSTTNQRLDELVAKLRSLPIVRQEAAIEVLSEIVEGSYQLSKAELAVLWPALQEALRGDNLTDAASDDLLTKPWR